MRTARWGLLLLVAASLPAQAQGWERVADDPTGDVDGLGSADVVSIDMRSGAGKLEFRLNLTALPQHPEGLLLKVVVDVDGTASRVDVTATPTQQEVQWRGGYYEGSRFIGPVDLAIQGTSILFELAAARVPGLADASPPAGISLSVHVETQSYTLYTVTTPDGAISSTGSDRAPDAGTGQHVTHGVQSSGPITLRSPDPWRQSNGEATTMVYEVEMSNSGSDVRRVELAAQTPDHWTAIIPGEVLEVEPGEAVRFPLALVTTMEHTHGAWESFDLEARSGTDVGRLRLGVVFPETPQPSGHHRVLHLHNHQTAEDDLDRYNGRLYMNARPSESGGPPAAAAIVPTGAPIVSPVVARWTIPMDPELAMGLQLEDRAGMLDIEVSSKLAIEGTRASAYLYRLEESTRLVANGSGDVFDIAAGAAHRVAFPVHPVPPLRHAYDPAVPLLLDIVLEWPAAPEDEIRRQAAGVGLHAGGTLALPLLEYRDNTTKAFQSIYGVRLAASGPSVRAAAPGSHVGFNVTVLNEGTAADTIQMTVVGADRTQGRLEHNAITLATREAQTLGLIVSVPENASMVDVLVVATSAADPSIRSLMRFIVEVDDDAETVDDRGWFDSPAQMSPAPFFVVVVLGWMAAWRRAST